MGKAIRSCYILIFFSKSFERFDILRGFLGKKMILQSAFGYKHLKVLKKICVHICVSFELFIGKLHSSQIKENIKPQTRAKCRVRDRY